MSATEDADWDVWWIDGYIQPSLLYKMKPYQRANHLPGIQELARKNFLARNLTLLQAHLPEEFTFFP